MTAQTLAEMRALLERFGLRPRPSLGQHFLADPNLTRRIVREAQIVPGDLVLEVGAGTGTLTRALAEAGASVTAVEVDERLQPVLEEVLAGLGVQLLIADALSIDYRLLLGDVLFHGGDDGKKSLLIERGKAELPKPGEELFPKFRVGQKRS